MMSEIKHVSRPHASFGLGLHPTPHDDRDFELFDFWHQPSPDDLPKGEYFTWTPPVIFDQGETSECSGHGTATALMAHEGVILNPSWQYAAIKSLTGDPTDDGADLRSAMQAGIKLGAVERAWCDLSVADHDGDFLADLANYPKELLQKALVHQQRSFFKAHTGRYDTFDNVRTWLWHFRDEKPVIVTGVGWRKNWFNAPGGIIPKEPGPIAGGHCIAILGGQTVINGETYLKIPNSWGPQAGDHGYFYVPREVVVRDFTYGAFIYRDKPASLIKAIYAEKRPKAIAINKPNTMSEDAPVAPADVAPVDPQPAPQPVWWLDSVTVRKYLLAGLPAVVLLLSLLGVNITADQQSAVIDAFDKLVVATTALISVWGMISGILHRHSKDGGLTLSKPKPNNTNTK